nr:hypothetical protein BdHM001_35860 [Bdellovibrio sp. HM001]
MCRIFYESDILSLGVSSRFKEGKVVGLKTLSKVVGFLGFYGITLLTGAAIGSDHAAKIEKVIAAEDNATYHNAGFEQGCLAMASKLGAISFMASQHCSALKLEIEAAEASKEKAVSNGEFKFIPRGTEMI